MVSQSVTKDRRSPDCVNENLGIMRSHSVSPALIQAFVTDLETSDPLTGLTTRPGPQESSVSSGRHMSIMVCMRETIGSFDVVGLPLRTSNREAARTIPPHWRAAADAGLLAPERSGVGPGIYAVYTDYETPGDDVEGVYTLVIGRRIEAGGPVPPGQVTVTIPNSTRDIVTLADARPESVYEAWVDVWARKDLTRDYRADYEYYAPDGSIHLSIGILSDT